MAQHAKRALWTIAVLVALLSISDVGSADATPQLQTLNATAMKAPQVMQIAVNSSTSTISTSPAPATTTSAMNSNNSLSNVVSNNASIIAAPLQTNATQQPLNGTMTNGTHSAFDDVRSEVAAIAGALRDSRDRVYHWLDNPTGHMIVIPAMVGVLAALSTVTLLAVLNCLIQRCASRRRQERIAKLTTDLNSERAQLLPTKSHAGGDDDEI